MGNDLASFKNSRVYGRKATTSAITDQDSVPGNANVNPKLILVADQNRTYITMRNLADPVANPLDSIMYGYATAGVPPTVAFLLSDGFELKPGEVANELENPEALYGVSKSVNAVSYCLDRGIG